MVVTDTLEKVDIKELTEAYNLGFSDYQVTLSMSKENLMRTLRKNGYEARSSIGLFDESTLVGFVLNGVRGTSCYDTGTAIIPTYRGKGYAHLLLEKTISLLKDQAIHTWVLEVLSGNAKAIRLYKGIGFTQQREFNCYHIKAETIREKETTTRVFLIRQKVIDVPHGECMPSWQNEKGSILAGGIPTWNITTENKKVGTLCYDPKTGSIAQIYVNKESRCKGFAREAIIEAAKLCKTGQLRFINIDDSYLPLNNLLVSLGFECFATQLEMTNIIGGRA